MKYEYDTVLHETDDNGGAYVVFPWDIRQEFGKGRVKVHADFDGIPYDGRWMLTCKHDASIFVGRQAVNSNFLQSQIQGKVLTSELLVTIIRER